MYTLATYAVDNVRVGEIFRKLRDDRDFTNEFIADKTGISLTTVKNILRGSGGLTFERALKLCALFKIPLVSLAALLVEGVPNNFASLILTYNPATGGTASITDERINPISDTIPDAVTEAALSIPSAPTHQTDCHHHATEHDPLMYVESLRSHIASLTAQIEQQNKTIDKLFGLIK